MNQGICVLVEERGGELRRAGLEALAEGLRQKATVGGTVTAVLVGTGLDAAAAKLAESGADRVVVYSRDDLSQASPAATAASFAHAVKDSGAGLALLAATVTGREVGAAAAAILDAGYAADCVALKGEGGTVHATRPVYAGKALTTVSTAGEILVASLRPNVFDGALPGGSSAEVSSAEPPLAADAPQARRTKLEDKGSEAKDVAEADVVVSGGRGTGGADGWGPIEDLAAALDGAVGASRAVVDAGWRPHSEQVGQTGKVVAPKLYIAAGISGMIQHLAGMRTAKTIVAINKDADAPIFKVADYGIVGDLHEVLPALTEAVKKIKAEG